MSLNELLLVGPINGLVLLVLLVGGLLVVGYSAIRLRRGEDVALSPLIIAIASPLLFTLYAVTAQYTWGLQTAASA